MKTLRNTSVASLSRWIRFWILVPSAVLSLGCCLLLLFYFVTNRKLRHGLHNHVIIVLVLLEFFYLSIDVTLYAKYLYDDAVRPETPAICLIWWVASDALHETITFLMAWAAFERHILILKHQWVSTFLKRLFVHYLPIGSILLYGFVFYGVMIFFPPCEHQFDFEQEWCGSACLFADPIFDKYQLVVNEVLFTVLISTFSIALIVRIVWQRRSRLHQPIQWRKHRKMTVQLVAIASNYLLFHLPEMIVLLANPFDPESEFARRFDLYMNFVGFFAEIFLPFICLASLYPRPWKRRNRLAVGDSLVGPVTGRRPQANRTEMEEKTIRLFH